MHKLNLISFHIHLMCVYCLQIKLKLSLSLSPLVYSISPESRFHTCPSQHDDWHGQLLTLVTSELRHTNFLPLIFISVHLENDPARCYENNFLTAKLLVETLCRTSSVIVDDGCSIPRESMARKTCSADY